MSEVKVDQRLTARTDLPIDECFHRPSGESWEDSVDLCTNADTTDIIQTLLLVARVARTWMIGSGSCNMS